MNRNDFPAYLAEQLKLHNITQAELADVLGIDATAVSRWLSTTRKTLIIPSIRSMENIEEALSRIIAKKARRRAVAL